MAPTQTVPQTQTWEAQNMNGLAKKKHSQINSTNDNNQTTTAHQLDNNNATTNRQHAPLDSTPPSTPTATTTPTPTPSSPLTAATTPITNGTSSHGAPNTSLSPSKCNLTLVLHEKLRMELEQRPLPPKPRPNEVTLATHTVGICGSDVKYWREGKIGNFVLRKPMILGHETSAIVMETGSDVRGLKKGDKVAVEVGLPCGSCQLCKSGKYNLCNQMMFAATPPYDGTLTRYFNHPADFCFKLPEAVSLEEGALLEPLAVAVHACQRAPIKLNDVVLVCGAGAVGLLSMLSAKAFGASHVIITDISASRLSFARQLGASATYLCERGASLEDMSNALRRIVAKLKPAVTAQDGAEAVGVNVALECSGAESSLNLAMQTVAVGGTIVCVGCQPDQVTVQLNQAITQEIDIKGVFRYRNCYPLALSLVETGRINLRPLVTHRFRLEEAVNAFETCMRGEGVKIMIKCLDEKHEISLSP